MYLLKNIQDNYEERSAYGSYIRPGTVLRCDGTDQNHLDKPDSSVIFVCFPYFDTVKGEPPGAQTDEAIHRPRGLFQSSYPQEIAKERDNDQMFRRFKHSKSGEYLRVPQLWVLVLSSRIIITCGPSKLQQMFETGVNFATEESLLLLTDGPTLVHVTDFYRRITYLNLDRCKTFLELRQRIEEECLLDTIETIDDCILHSGEGEEELDASQWPKLLSTKTSAFVYVRLSRKVSTPPEPKDSDSPTSKVHSVSGLIDYADLSSGESSDEGSHGGYGKDLVTKDYWYLIVNPPVFRSY